MFCPRCGRDNPDGVKFCPGCGYQFSEALTGPGPGQAPSVPSAMATAPASAFAGGLTVQSRRIILVALASIVLLISCFVPVFTANDELYKLSIARASGVSSSLGGPSYGTGGWRIGASYSLFDLDDYTRIALQYENELHYGGKIPTAWSHPFLLGGIACCALFAIGCVRTIAKGKCGLLAAFSCSILVLYPSIPSILGVKIMHYLPSMDGIAWFMMVVAAIEAVLAFSYMKSGLTRDAAQIPLS